MVLEQAVIATHEEKCMGADIEGIPILDSEKAEAAIVVVYNTGQTEVLCRYHNRNEIRCNAANKSDPRDNGLCIYFRK